MRLKLHLFPLFLFYKKLLHIIFRGNGQKDQLFFPLPYNSSNLYLSSYHIHPDNPVPTILLYNPRKRYLNPE
jgi:hypothetical protein